MDLFAISIHLACQLLKVCESWLDQLLFESLNELQGFATNWLRIFVAQIDAVGMT